MLKIRLSIGNICAEKCQLYNVYFMFERPVQMAAVILCYIMLLQNIKIVISCQSFIRNPLHLHNLSSNTQLNGPINYILLSWVCSHINHVIAPAMVHIGKQFVCSQQFVRTERCLSIILRADITQLPKKFNLQHNIFSDNPGQ